MAIRELRPTVLLNCAVLRAILAFNYHLTPDNKRHIDSYIQEAQTAPAKRLKEISRYVNSQVKHFSDLFGCIQKPKEFAAEFYTVCDTGSIPNIPKGLVDTHYFRNFAGGNQVWNSFPPHLRLMVHADHIVQDPIVFNWWLPEAILYEDMALAYNSAVETSTQGPHTAIRPPNVQNKLHGMYVRTAVLSAYYFVEAYLNGIAFDFYHRNQATLTAQQKTLLLEWDSVQNKRAWVNFERKVFDYPKIILGCQHPPLTPTNSSSLKLLLGDAKDYRDALVHQSPKTRDLLTEVQEKVKLMMGLNLEQAGKVVDAAVEFVGELNTLLAADGMFLDWLYPRSSVPPRTFPPEAFV